MKAIIYEVQISSLVGRVKNMDPWSMNHHCGPGPWTSSWTRSMDYPCVPTSFCIVIYEVQISSLVGRVKNMDPWSMNHHCGPGPWTSSWTRSMDYPCVPTSFCIVTSRKIFKRKREVILTLIWTIKAIISL